MVKFLILPKRLLSQAPVDLDQALVQRPDELHAAHASEQLRHRVQHARVLGPHRDAAVAARELDVARRREAVEGAHPVRVGGRESVREEEHALEEDDELVGEQAVDVGFVGREGWRFAEFFARQRFPLARERVHAVDEAGVEVGFGREPGFVDWCSVSTWHGKNVLAVSRG